jgi:hypothetical protein
MENRSGIKNVKYVNGDFKNGAQITVENIGQLPMPTNVQVKFKDGTQQMVKLPIEVWKRNTEWTFRINSTKEIDQVKLDPNSEIPDVDSKNNTWSSADAKPTEKVNLKEFTGTFGSKDLPMKIVFTEKNNQLFAQATGQQEFPLEYTGNNTFSLEMAQISLTFSQDKNHLPLSRAEENLNLIKNNFNLLNH